MELFYKISIFIFSLNSVRKLKRKTDMFLMLGCRLLELTECVTVEEQKDELSHVLTGAGHGGACL